MRKNRFFYLTALLTIMLWIAAPPSEATAQRTITRYDTGYTTPTISFFQVQFNGLTDSIDVDFIDTIRGCTMTILSISIQLVNGYTLSTLGALSLGDASPGRQYTIPIPKGPTYGSTHQMSNPAGIPIPFIGPNAVARFSVALWCGTYGYQAPKVLAIPAVLRVNYIIVPENN